MSDEIVAAAMYIVGGGLGAVVLFCYKILEHYDLFDEDQKIPWERLRRLFMFEGIGAVIVAFVIAPRIALMLSDGLRAPVFVGFWCGIGWTYIIEALRKKIAGRLEQWP